MPNQFFSPEGDLEYYFADEYWLVDQYVGDTLFSWGNIPSDNVGTAVRSTPRQEFTSSTIWKQVSAGYNHVLAVKEDGTLWAWGSGGEGSIGDNTIGNRSTPRQISSGAGVGVNGWVQVSGGRFHSAAIRNDGTLWTWGSNDSCQIGDNVSPVSVARRSVPRQISIAALGGLNGWVQVSAGGYHTAAIRSDGTLWVWGSNANGQIGDNTSGTTNRSTPRQISAGSNGITGWKQVSCGYMHTAALRTDGTLWVWGDNTNGQIGDNTSGADRLTPRQISIGATGITNWKQVAAGSQHTAAVAYSGGLWVWGLNASGQLGDNTNISKSVPTQEFTASTNWKYVATGTNAVRAIKTNGTLWSWGGNANGQIGDNTTGQSRSTPRQEASSSTNWKQVSAGFNHSVAVKVGVELN